LLRHTNDEAPKEMIVVEKNNFRFLKTELESETAVNLLKPTKKNINRMYNLKAGLNKLIIPEVN
jgi:hypothetical protein